MRRLTACLTALLLPTLASAAVFDPETGRLSAEPGSVFWGFEGLASKPDGLGFSARGTNGGPVGESTLRTRFFSAPEGLEGVGVFALGGAVATLDFDLTGFTDRLAGRRVEIRFWQRAEGWTAEAELWWTAGSLVEAHATGDMSRLRMMAFRGFQPTGRATDDGWVELTSGPFDYLLGSRTEPDLLTIGRATRGWYGAEGTASVVRLDALEILDLGPAAVPDATCTLPTEADDCGEAGICYYGRCADAGLVLGPTFASPEIRRDWLRRRAFEYAVFDGSRHAQSVMPALRDAFAALEEETRPQVFWPALDAAVQALRDGHAAAPTYAYPDAPSAGVCLHLGEADLLPEPGLAPLVFHTDSMHAARGLLQSGDVLVEIDGEPVDTWAARAARWISHGGDPRARDVVTTPQILKAAVMAGARVAFLRCPTLEPGCAAAERIELDLAAAVGVGLWEPVPPPREDLPCDYRYRRLHDDPQADDFALAELSVDPAAGVPVLTFNGFPSTYSRSGAAWLQVFEAAVAGRPEALIVDERLGYGGSADAVMAAIAYFHAEAAFSVAELFPQMDPPLDGLLYGALESCWSTSSELFPCGHSERWSPWDYGAPSAGLAADTRLALLLGSDVSGNDFFTRMMATRSAATRVFGPAPTWGAYGAIYELPVHAGELSGGSFQIHDTRFPASPVDAPGFETGTGADPDEVVHQRQSDLLQGIDTLYEAALAWITASE